MPHDDMKAACDAYALGLLDGDERAAFELHLAACEDCRKELEAQHGVVAALGLGEPRRPAPARLKRRLLSAIAVDGYYTLRADEGEWESDARGPALRRLFLHPRDGTETRIVRFAPAQNANDAGVPPGSALYLLAGDLDVDGVPLTTGDFHRRAGSAREPLVRSRSGAVVLVLTPAARVAADLPAHTVHADQGPWVPLGPGARGRVLMADPATGLSVVYGAMGPGCEYPEHDHEGAEELFMLEGDCAFQDRSLAPGDYFRAADGSHHDVTRTVDGCVMLVVHRRESAAL